MTDRSVRRRGNGEGTIFYEAERHRWVGILDLGTIDGKRARRKVRARTRTEVARQLRELATEQRQTQRPASVRTVADVLGRWLSTVAASRFGEDSTTYATYRHQVEQHLSPALGAIALDRLHPEQIDDYLAAKARAGYSRATLVKHRSVLGQALRWGVKRRYLTWDPASLAELPPADVFAAAKPKQTRTPRALTADEAKKFLAAAAIRNDGENRRNGAALAVALTTGLRPGELLALAWDDLDLDNGVLSVRRAWKGTKASRHLGDPKTKGSVRSIDLAPPVVTALVVHRRTQLAERLRSQRWNSDLDLVFATKHGDAIDPANLRRLCTEVADEAEVGHVTPYDLRHTATSLLSEAGVRNEELADLLGHVDTRMVERHYRHRLSSSVGVAAGPMAELLA
jgi:integrase